METEKFIQYMREQQNPEKIPGMERYMRNKFKFLGLQAAERRKLARPFMKSWRHETKNKHNQQDNTTSIIDWETLQFLWQQPEREFQLIGVDYLKDVEQYLVIEDLPKLKNLILTKSWWDTVDFLAKNVGRLALKEPDIKTELIHWSKESNIWVRRSAILHQLNYKENTDRPLMYQIIENNLNDDEFFINKAIGWALREFAKTDEKWVLDLIQEFEENLQPLSVREATKNINLDKL